MTTAALLRPAARRDWEKRGIAIPGLIRNGNFYFTELKAFANGLFDAWGGLDLDFLDRKFQSGWISPRIPDGANFSAHSLIHGKVISGSWSHDSNSLHQRLVNDLQSLNPGQQELIDFEGEDVEIKEGVRYAKYGWIRTTPQRKHQSEKSPLGETRYAFISQKGQVYLVPLRIYADGLIDVHPQYGEEKLVDLHEFQSMLETKELCYEIDDHTSIEIDSLGRFEVSGVHPCVYSSEDFMSEIEDSILKLNGVPGSIHHCLLVHQEYQKNQTPENKARLKQAYEAIPEHNRMYAGDMDSKDGPIRRIIYEDQDSDYDF